MANTSGTIAACFQHRTFKTEESLHPGRPGVASPGEVQWHLERCPRGHPSQASCRCRSAGSGVARPRIRSPWIAAGRRTSNSGYLKQPTCSTSEPWAPAPPPVQANSVAITKGPAQASSYALGLCKSCLKHGRLWFVVSACVLLYDGGTRLPRVVTRVHENELCRCRLVKSLRPED